MFQPPRFHCPRAITHWFEHQAFEKGHFSVQRQEKHGFSGVACNTTIQQTAKRYSKTRGGMKGFTTNTGASNRWIGAPHGSASSTWQCEEMAGREKKGAMLNRSLLKTRKLSHRNVIFRKVLTQLIYSVYNKTNIKT